jgi:hypothetical protein
MPVPTLIRREHLNCRFYFIPAGEVVDTITVSKTTWPDNAPLTNWTNYQFADIEKVTPAIEVETEEFNIPNDGGGYTKDTEESVVMRKWTLSTSKTNSYLKRLEHALSGFPAAGTAVVPGTKNDNFILGVSLFEYQLKSGVVSERWQIWSKLRLVDPGEVGPKTRLLQFSVEHQDSGNNTYVMLAGS